MADWFIHQAGGNHIGPVSSELIVRGVQAGKVPADAYVAAQSGGGWVPLSSVPELAAAIAGPTLPIDPPRTIPPAPAAKPVDPPAPAAKPIPMRRMIPIAIFGVFALLSIIAAAVAATSSPKPATSETHAP